MTFYGMPGDSNNDFPSYAFEKHHAFWNDTELYIMLMFSLSVLDIFVAENNNVMMSHQNCS